MVKTLSQVMAEQKAKKQPTQKDTTPEYKKKEDSLNYAVKDSTATAIKTGVTESFIMPFAIAMQASSGMLAIVASLPELIGSFLQLYAQESLKFFKTRRRMMVIAAFFQALMWIPIMFIPFINNGDLTTTLFLIFLFFVVMQTALGQFQGPIYNSVLGDLIDDDKRGEFFGRRNRIVNLITFISTVVAGLILNYFKGLDGVGHAHYIFVGFIILFSMAFITRIIAVYYKSKMYDPPFVPSTSKGTLTTFIKNMTHNNYGIFVLFMFLFRFATAISAPFFALYILRDMHMGYLAFTAIIGAFILASFLSMRFWGKLIDTRGSKYVLAISVWLIPLSPLLLVLAIFIQNPLWVFIFLFLEEAFSGVMWAAFNLSTSSFLFDATAKEERIKYIAYYNCIVGVGIVLGSLLGGLLMEIYPIWIVSAIPLIYLTTGILRLVVSAIMIKKVREARMVEVNVLGQSFFHSIVAISPHHGTTVQIIEIKHEKKHEEEKIIEKRKTIDPVKKTERKTYEKKSFEYYKNNAMNTMSGKKEETPKDDSDKIEKEIENKKRDEISKIAEDMRKGK